jgi:hypothetical protein
MTFRNRFELLVIGLFLVSAPILRAQQKGQYVPGQWGLNAGVIPAPGITYANQVLNHSASRGRCEFRSLPPKP